MSGLAREIRDHRSIGKNTPLFCYESVDSTNDELFRISRFRDLPNGTAVLAESQSRGKGRTGRVWHSPSGLGIYLSVLFRLENQPALLSQLTLAAGVSVCKTLQRTTGRSPELKWPNDVRYDGLKVGGILTEAQARNGSIRNVVVGIGVNVSHGPEDFPDNIRPTSTSISLATGRTPDRHALTAGLLDDLETTVERWRAEGFSSLADTWKRNSSTIGRKVRVLIENQPIEGMAVALTDEGALMIEAEGGELVVDTGEVIEL